MQAPPESPITFFTYLFALRLRAGAISTATTTLQSVLFPISQFLTTAEHTPMNVSKIFFEKQGETRPELQSLWLLFLKSPCNGPVLSQFHSALAPLDPWWKARLLPGAGACPCWAVHGTGFTQRLLEVEVLQQCQCCATTWLVCNFCIKSIYFKPAYFKIIYMGKNHSMKNLFYLDGQGWVS